MVKTKLKEEHVNWNKQRLYTMFISVCLEEEFTHRAVVVFRAKVTVLLTPVDLIEATVANLTNGLMRDLVHSCQQTSKHYLGFITVLWKF